MWKSLRALIKKSEAPITNRKVSCILMWEKWEKYTGYNIETEKEIIHAEVNAIQKVKEDFKIKEIALMAGWRSMNVKHVIPCENCAKSLSPYITKKSNISFYFFEENKKYSLNLEKLLSSYILFAAPLKMVNNTIDDFLKKHTPLLDIDRRLLVKIYHYIQQYCITANVPLELYLTGSSSWRWWPKSILAKKITGVPYRDIDLILIFPREIPNEINSIIIHAYEDALKYVWYPLTSIDEKEELPYRLEESKSDKKNKWTRKVYYDIQMETEIQAPTYKKRRDIPSIIDISIWTTLESTITDKYLTKKRYIQLI